MARSLVTGGAGFIGHHLVTRLAQRGHEVVVIDNLKRASPARLTNHPGVRLVEEDIRSLAPLADVMRGCKTVYHLAAQSNVMGSVDDPAYGITTNVLGTYNVLLSAAAAGVSRVVFASSREVYGDPTTLPVAEEHPFSPKNAYGASKVAGEAYCRSVAATHGLRVGVIRLANVYGPGDSGRVIPTWLEAAHEGRDLQVFGGEQVMDFLWVGTAVDALLLAAETGLPGPVNVGSGKGTHILELAERVLRATGSTSRIVCKAARRTEVTSFVADTRLMRSLGLQPDADPLQHLEDIVDSYRPPTRVRSLPGKHDAPDVG